MGVDPELKLRAVPAPRTTGPAKIVVSDITKRFATDTGMLDVVGGISFTVADGEMIAIVGPSGCGKSTLMKVIAGFETPTSGEIRIDDTARRGPSANGILISQHGSVFPWLTVRENLMFGLVDGSSDQKEDLADHYAALVGLEGFEDTYPHELSGGMVKRVEIARALVVKPHILYMDEPLSALDALTSLKMQNELLRILDEEKHTVVLITHDVEEALHMADRVLVLSPRPTKIQATFALPPRPREVSSPELQALKVAILRELGL